MDPISAEAISAVLVPLATGAAGEAGKQALDRLVTFVRARFGRAVAEDDDAPRLATLLEHAAAEDDDVADWLHDWLARSAPLVAAPTDVANIITGQARVSGNVIQAHTISGGVNFGSPRDAN